MAKVLTGVLTKAENPRIKRGEIAFKEVVFQGSDGKVCTWKDLSMARETAEVLKLGEPVTLYLSPFMGELFGVRTAAGAAVFKADAANPLFLVMAIGMIFLGLGTSMFLFPLLIALGGAAGVVLHLQAAGAKARFRRDGRAADAVQQVGPVSL